jgi:hypothetical protein
MATQTIQEKMRPKAAPTGLNYSGTVEGYKIHTSDKLSEEFFKIIDYAKVLGPVRETMKILTNKGLIVPCYTSSNAIKWFIKKAWISITTSQYTFAFFSTDTNKIYVAFDYQWHSYGINESLLGRILIHELQHFAAFNMKNQYYSMFKGVYAEWYQYFWNYYFDTIDVKAASCKDQVHFLTKTFEWARNPVVIKKFIGDYRKIVEGIAQRAKVGENPEVKIRINEFMMIMEQFFISPSKYPFSIHHQLEPYWSFYKSCLNAYKRLGKGGHKSGSVFIQELLIPSEIASMTSEHPESKHYNVINQLKNKSIKTYN